jgi:hypothetical protein
MKVELTKRIEQTVIIDIELPYYFEHDISGDFGSSVIYGKIEATECIRIQRTFTFHDQREEYIVKK